MQANRLLAAHGLNPQFNYSLKRLDTRSASVRFSAPATRTRRPRPKLHTEDGWSLRPWSPPIAS